MSFLIGAGLSELSCFKKDVGMMGYGMSTNTVHESATPLHARSLWIEDQDGGKFIYACVEICFITPSVRREVFNRMKAIDSNIEESQLMISAQHTHYLKRRMRRRRV